MTRLRCGPLTAWANAWLGGSAAFDDVLSAASVGAAAPVLAASAPPLGGATTRRYGDDGRASPLGEILIDWRLQRSPVRLALPVPGDVRGLPTSRVFSAAAIDAGQAVVAGNVGIVPVVIDHSPSSAPASLSWHRFEVEEPAPDTVSITDAQYELTEAIRECASALARVDLATLDGSTELNDELGRARRAGERINLPPGFPPKAVALVAQAERMAAVLSLAGAYAAPMPDGRTEALAPLVTAVRRARLAGYNAEQ